MPVELPVGAPVRIRARVDPVALLQTHDADAGTGEPPGDGGAGRAGADDEDIDATVGGHRRRLYGTSEAAVSSSLTFQSLAATAES